MRKLINLTIILSLTSCGYIDNPKLCKLTTPSYREASCKLFIPTYKDKNGTIHIIKNPRFYKKNPSYPKSQEIQQMPENG